MNYNMKTGDLLYRSKGIVKHNGVYIGQNKVLHNSPINGVEIISYNKFSDGLKVSIVSPSIHDEKELDLRLHEVLNSNDSYNFAFNNCEHIANYLVFGRRHSPQIQATLVGAGIAYLISDKDSTSKQVFMTLLGGFIGCSLSNISRNY